MSTMLDNFLYRWRTLTRNQQIIIAVIVGILLFGLLSGQGLLSLPRLLAIGAILLLALPIHEYAHAATAVALGDNTPRIQGRLTLDPRAHLDWVGGILLFLTGFGWAKPVQWNPNRVNMPVKQASILIALAGPASNLVLALISLLLSRLLGASMFTSFLVWFATINVYLAVFNLIPIPPLDGSHVLFALLPGDNSSLQWQLRQYGFVILFIVIMLVPGLIRGPAMLVLQILNGMVNLVT
ncbi:MAG: site-2 protease family protein [Caldilineaceae bacterium]